MEARWRHFVPDGSHVSSRRRQQHVFRRRSHLRTGSPWSRDVVSWCARLPEVLDLSSDNEDERDRSPRRAPPNTSNTASSWSQSTNTSRVNAMWAIRLGLISHSILGPKCTDERRVAKVESPDPCHQTRTNRELANQALVVCAW